MYKAILFDLDGTLIDSMEIFYEIVYDLLKNNTHIKRQSIKDLYFLTSGQPFHKQLPTMLPGESKQNMKQLAAYFETEKEKRIKNIRFDPETLETLQKLKAKGYLLVVSSSSRPQITDDLFAEHKGLFAAVLGHRSSRFYKGKPHISFIKKTFGLQSQDILYVGDSLNDAKMAKENGIDFIAKLGTFSKEDFMKIDPTIRTISRIGDLITLLR